MKINIFYDIKKYKLRQKKKHVEWIYNIAKKLGLDNGRDINIVLVGRNTILKINREFLQHNYVTDVISFYYDKDSTILGEIYICPYQVKRNARRYSVLFEEELRRVIAHGMLHLYGYDDVTETERNEMKIFEDRMLELW